MTEHDEKFICGSQMYISIINPCDRVGDCYVARTKQKESFISVGHRMLVFKFSKDLKSASWDSKSHFKQYPKEYGLNIWEAVWKHLPSHYIQTERNSHFIISVSTESQKHGKRCTWQKQVQWMHRLHETGKKDLVRGQEMWSVLVLIPHFLCESTHTFVIILNWHS